MKILLISNMYPSSESPFYGIFVKNFENQLKDDFNISKVVLKGRGKSKLEKIKKYFIFFKNVIKYIKENDYDLIYVHYIGHSLLPVLLVKNYINKPLILNAHGSDVLTISKSAKIIQKLVAPIIKSASLIVVPSHYFKNVVQDKFILDESHIFISPSGGVDTKLFKPLKVKRSELFTIGYVSRIDSGKGWDTLLDAVYLLKNNNIDFKVLMLGSGSQEDLLLKKIADLDLEHIIEYVGPKPHEELVGYFNEMDLFAFTTRLAESLGLVGLEAMACGVPVVGSKIGGLQDYICENENGLFFEVGNSKELFEKILYMYEHQSLLIKMKEKARDTALIYDKNKVSKAMVNTLNEVINEKI